MKTEKVLMIFAVAALVSATSAPRAMACPDNSNCMDRQAAALGHLATGGEWQVGKYKVDRDGHMTVIDTSKVDEEVSKKIGSFFSSAWESLKSGASTVYHKVAD